MIAVAFLRRYPFISAPEPKPSAATFIAARPPPAHKRRWSQKLLNRVGASSVCAECFCGHPERLSSIAPAPISEEWLSYKGFAKALKKAHR
jgi:hypothetical protein